MQEAWVFAKWDEKFEVYYSESNIPGLNIEADNLGEFEAVLFDVAPELIFENIIKPQMAEDGYNYEYVGADIVAKPRKAPFAKPKTAPKIPEMVPLCWRGSDPRKLNLAMA